VRFISTPSGHGVKTTACSAMHYRISHSIASEGGCVRRTARTSDRASHRTGTFLDHALCSDCVHLTPCTLDCAHSCEVLMFTIVSSRYRTPPMYPPPDSGGRVRTRRAARLEAI
jgi:hypothetical protein